MPTKLFYNQFFKCWLSPFISTINSVYFMYILYCMFHGIMYVLCTYAAGVLILWFILWQAYESFCLLMIPSLPSSNIRTSFPADVGPGERAFQQMLDQVKQLSSRCWTRWTALQWKQVLDQVNCLTMKADVGPGERAFQQVLDQVNESDNESRSKTPRRTFSADYHWQEKFTQEKSENIWEIYA